MGIQGKTIFGYFSNYTKTTLIFLQCFMHNRQQTLLRDFRPKLVTFSVSVYLRFPKTQTVHPVNTHARLLIQKKRRNKNLNIKITELDWLIDYYGLQHCGHHIPYKMPIHPNNMLISKPQTFLLADDLSSMKSGK